MTSIDRSLAIQQVMERTERQMDGLLMTMEEMMCPSPTNLAQVNLSSH
jgi:hypothetical protein